MRPHEATEIPTTFTAHQVVLEKASPELKNHFLLNDTDENLTIELANVKPSAVAQFLHWAYKGVFPSVQSNDLILGLVLGRYATLYNVAYLLGSQKLMDMVVDEFDKYQESVDWPRCSEYCKCVLAADLRIMLERRHVKFSDTMREKSPSSITSKKKSITTNGDDEMRWPRSDSGVCDQSRAGAEAASSPVPPSEIVSRGVKLDNNDSFYKLLVKFCAHNWLTLRDTPTFNKYIEDHPTFLLDVMDFEDEEHYYVKEEAEELRDMVGDNDWCCSFCGLVHVADGRNIENGLKTNVRRAYWCFRCQQWVRLCVKPDPEEQDD